MDPRTPSIPPRHPNGRPPSSQPPSLHIETRELNKVDVAYEKLKTWVINYHFKPGEQLIVSRLSELLGVGLTPVREALLRLHYNDLVAPAYNGGFTVKSLDATELVDQYRFAFLLHERVVGESLRELSKFSRHQLEHLRDGLAAAAAGDESSAAVGLVEDAHITVANLMRNRPISTAIAHFVDRTHFIRSVTIENNGAGPSVIQDMVDLMEALLLQNTTSSLEVLDRQIVNQLQRLPQVIKDGLSLIYEKSSTKY